jgi:hypothetical protein
VSSVFVHSIHKMAIIAIANIYDTMLFVADSPAWREADVFC